MNLEYLTVSGNLGEVSQLRKNGYCLQTSSELLADFCKGDSNSNLEGCYYVANGVIVYPKDDSFFLAYTSGKNNLLLQPDHLDESLTKLPPNKFFRLDGTEESWKIINDSTTFRFNLSQLVSDRHNKCFSENLPISNPRGYSRLNPEQQRFLQVVGYTPENLEYLSRYNLNFLRVGIPNPKELNTIFTGNNNTPIWSASWLEFFNTGSHFFANCHCINYIRFLRGIK